jgi:hypothetical protein
MKSKSYTITLTSSEISAIKYYYNLTMPYSDDDFGTVNEQTEGMRIPNYDKMHAAIRKVIEAK